MIVGVPKESFPGERRVALVPVAVPALQKGKMEVVVETGAGVAASYSDSAYSERGAIVVGTRAEVFAKADVILQVRAAGANPEAGRTDLDLFREGQILVALCEPLAAPEPLAELARRNVSCFALELVPRITRAQSMDVLSSMGTITGYKAVILAAEAMPRMFPLLMTAAGTLQAVRVLVLGAGVAGLQAIGTARRLGAVVEAYDVRPVVREQVESLGAKFVDLGVDTRDAEDAGGYAKAQSEQALQRQREALTKVVAADDIVITTALVPGKRAPVLLTADMVRAMSAGAVVVDLAADKGGNCELTRPGQTVVEGGVTILGPVNLASTVPNDASQMFSKNLVTFLLHAAKDGQVALESEDEIIRGTLVCRGGKVVNDKVQSALGAGSAPPAVVAGQGAA